MEYSIVCTKCANREDGARFRCRKCGSILEVKYEYAKAGRDRLFRNAKGISRYANLLPLDKALTLNEGRTPMPKVHFNGINAAVFLKVETGNPTGTFKDRGSAVEISKAVELNAKGVCCASTGNMGLSVAHYARSFGLMADIFISKDANKNKIIKIKAQGAHVKLVDGGFNRAVKEAETFSRIRNVFLCGDYHFREEGQKTIAFEIAEQMRRSVPDYVFAPIGNGTLFCGMHKGFMELKRHKIIRKVPRMVAVQSDGCNPLVKAYDGGTRIGYMRPKTEADAIAVGYPVFGYGALDAIKESGGAAVSAYDSEIKDAVRLLEKRGVYAELGGGTAFAGFLRMYGRHKRKLEGKRIVVTITGNNEGKS